LSIAIIATYTYCRLQPKRHQYTVITTVTKKWTKRSYMRAYCQIPARKSQWVTSGWVTIRRCGLFPNYFCHLLLSMTIDNAVGVFVAVSLGVALGVFLGGFLLAIITINRCAWPLAFVISRSV